MKTEKRLAYEAKQARKLAHLRTKEERQAEIDKIYEKLHELGINDNFIDEYLIEFREIADKYINTGGCYTGKIKIEVLGRNLIYNLVMDRRNQVAAMLQVIE